MPFGGVTVRLRAQLLQRATLHNDGLVVGKFSSLKEAYGKAGLKKAQGEPP